MCGTQITIEYIATLLGIAAGLLWLLAANVNLPRLQGIAAPIDVDAARRSAEAYRLQASRNKRAAVVTALAVLFTAIAMTIPCGQPYSIWRAPDWLGKASNWDLGIANWKDFLIVVAPFVTATVLIATLIATINMTRSQKRSDNAKDFGEQFNKLMEKKEAWVGESAVPDAERQEAANIAETKKIKHYYAQLYALQFTEFYAFRSATWSAVYSHSG
jgi:hypothetical protein